jgi:pimeloyl-ACP methyl ester carboxylesterase
VKDEAPIGSGLIDAGGVQLAYDVAGSGAPLVLVHAGVADRRMWDGHVERFGGHYRVVRFDVRGFGQSIPAKGAYALHEDLRTLLDRLGIERAALVGVSMGGGLVLDFALEYPERVSALVLVNAAVSGLARSEAVLTGWEEEEAALERGDLDAAIEVNLRMWVDGPARSAEEVDPAVRERVAEMLRHNLPLPEPGERRRLDPPALDRLHELRAPVLAITGTRDMPDSAEVATRIAAAVPHARHATLEGAHMVSMERPEAIDRLVLEFLDGAV